MDSLGHHGRHCRPGRPFPRPLGSEAGYQVSVTWPQLRQGSMTFVVIMLHFLPPTSLGIVLFLCGMRYFVAVWLNSGVCA